jgi:hypothetical protein
MNACRSVNLYLPNKLIDDARKLAGRENRSMSQLIGELIRRRASAARASRPKASRLNATTLSSGKPAGEKPLSA